MTTSDIGRNNPKMSANVPYSLPGIVCYLQHEWTKMESDRQSWSLQKAEFEAKISLLNGEINGLQNLKLTLVRRIKMLEYALRQERFNTDSSNSAESKITAESQSNPRKDISPSVDSSSALHSVRRGKQLIQKFLNEMGHMDDLIDLRCERMRFSLQEKFNEELLQSEQALNLQLNGELNSSECQNDQPRNEQELFEKDDSNALNQFAFLENSEFSEDENINDWVQDCDVNDNATSWLSSSDIDLRFNADTKLVIHNDGFQNGESDDNDFDMEARFIDEQIAFMSSDRNDSNNTVRSKACYSLKEERCFEERATLHGHMDVVRCMTIHNSAPLLISGSDDHTAKLWDISDTLKCKTLALDIVEPIVTIRKHTSCVSAVCIGPKINWFFTGDICGNIFLWSIVSLLSQDWNEEDNIVNMLASLGGYDSSIVCLDTIISMDILLTSCSDNSIQIWHVDKCDSSNVIPSKPVISKDAGTAIRFLQISNHKEVLVAFNRGRIAKWNVCEEYLTYVIHDLSVKDSHILNDISYLEEHNVEIVVAAYSNGHLRWFELNTGKFIRSMLTHQSSVTAVIAGLSQLVTSAHDGFLRLWVKNEKDQYICKQEQLIHRHKADESVILMCGRISLFASAGADSVCRIFVLNQDKLINLNKIEDSLTISPFI